MRGRMLLAAVAAGMLIAGGNRWEPPIRAEALTQTLLHGMSSSQICLMPQAPAFQTRGGGAGSNPLAEGKRSSNDWPPPNVMGGDVMPVRSVFDPYPTFDAVAVDPAVGRAFFSDSSLSGLLSYQTTAGNLGSQLTEAHTHIIGPQTGIGFIAGIAVDPERKEVYAVNNDGGGVVVFNYDDTGATRPVRQLETPHQSWGISVSPARNEVAVSVQQLHAVVVYNRENKGFDKPLRRLRGYATGIADPHGVDIDDVHKELVVANHGNWTELRPYSPYDPLSKDPPSYEPGRFDGPSVRVFAADADGNAKPLRVIGGTHSGLNWPMGLEVDNERDEIVVANYGDNTVRFYKRSATGDVGSVRMIGGDKTLIRGPVDVTVDRKNNELWVANYADHTAVIFDRGASGNVSPKRIIRNGPAGAPALAFTNASACAYDSKRDALIVPN
jgi:DNA-binding beta-propeller fold protein YncE